MYFVVISLIDLNTNVSFVTEKFTPKFTIAFPEAFVELIIQHTSE